MAAASPAAGANRAFVKSFGQGGAPATKVLHQAPETQVLGAAPATKQLGPDKAAETQKLPRAQGQGGQPSGQEEQEGQGKNYDAISKKALQMGPQGPPNPFKRVQVRAPGIPDPGSITFPLLFILLLLFFVQPVSGTKKTRAQWLWSVVTGSGHLPMPDSGVWNQKHAWGDQWNQKATG